MYTICYIVFFVLSTLAAFKNDTRKLNALYRQPNTVYSAAFITACSHTTKMQKTGYSFCYALFFMAESEGFGSLRSPSSLLRKLSYYRLLLTRLRLAKDCKGSNPVFTFKQKTGHSFCYALFFMAESKGLGSLRSPASLLRKLSYCKPLLTRLRLAKDCKGSNPLLSYQQKNKGYSKRYTLYSWRRARDSNPRTVLGGYTISNRAPSTSSDNSP